ncbi:hypothetical protein BD779DRAFT_1038462 [Infundibulicybe gibba]|nr:hypothetical protein BD779DRAFT_1038462 [Infundibulicybe gibba]
MKVIRYRHAMEQLDLEGVLEALQGHLESEEYDISRSIATIHRHRNLLVPVMRLPPEILSRIFVFHAQMERGWLDAALTSTHVCKRWWQIGRACPELWSHIRSRECRSAAWMARMIKRSRMFPLSLTISSQADTEKMALVVNHMHRFKSLNLDVPPGDGSAIFEVFSQPVPLLQHLTILSFGYSSFAFPPEFLGGSAPNLRHMKLNTRRRIPWDSGLFAHLVTLDVSGSENFGDATPLPLGTLLSALARMPELEILILHRCFPPPAPPATADARVDLPHLKRLDVLAPLVHCTCFIRWITIDASATVLLNIKCSSVSREDVEEFFMVFPSHLYTTSTSVAQALKFVWRDPYNFKIDVWTGQQNTEFEDFQNANVNLVFDWESIRLRGVSPLDLTWTSFAALASPQLRSFRIWGSPIDGWDADVWRRLARVAPDLQRLATGMDVQSTELCKALSPPDAPDPAPADCCLPTLSYLELQPPRFHPIPTPDEEESPLPVTLARTLAARALIGCSTPKLVFIASRRDYPRGWFKKFHAVPNILVYTVQWYEEPEM